MPLSRHLPARRRSYLLAGVLLSAAAVGVAVVDLVSSEQFHTLTEVVAATVAFAVGTLLLVAYFAVPDRRLLLLGVAFFGTGALDAFHAVVTAEWFSQAFPSALDSLAPWGWLASRVYLGAMLALSAVLWTDPAVRRARGREPVVFAAVLATAIAVVLLFTLVPLPDAYYPSLVWHRPGEAVAAVLFIAALMFHLRGSEWRTDLFDHWLTFALIVSVASQSIFMPLSAQLFDLEFDSAHLLKIFSYLLVLVGLMTAIFRQYRDARRARDQLAEANRGLEDLVRSKDDFLATVSHELRTPLTSVIGFAELLARADSDADIEERNEMLRMITAQGHDLSSLVEDLLAAARANMGELTVSRSRVTLRAQTAQVVETLSVTTGRAPSISGSGAVLTADPARVRQIIRNLLTNAERYGGPTVEVHVGQHGDHGWVEVIDDGAGVPAGDQERIFEAYERASRPLGLPASVGVGLSLSRELARVMGGDLTYERRNGLTVFSLRLPVHVDAEVYS